MNNRLLILSLLASASIPSAAFAQAATTPGAPGATPEAAPGAAVTPPPSDQLGEITVTARKSSENLTDVPLAITAVTAAAIENRGIRDITQIAAFTPGLTFQNQSVGRNDRGFKQYVIRGIIPNSSLATRQTVTVFVDGAPVSGGNLSGVTDIEQVEVIKGPQSALFGRSTFAGAINVTTRAPSYTWGGEVDGEYSRFDTKDVSASIEGGLIPDKLAFRLSGRIYHTDGGYTDSNYPDTRLGRRNTQSISLSLLAQPTETLTIRGFATSWTDDDGLPANAREGVGQGNCHPNPLVPSLTYYCGAIGDTPASTRTWNETVNPTAYSAVQNGSTLFGPQFVDHLGLHRTAQQYRVTANQELGDWVLSGIGSYGRNKWGFMQTALGEDYRNIPNPNKATNANVPYVYSLTLGNTEDRDAYGEVRLATPKDKRLTATLGANYAWARTDNLTSSYQLSAYVLNTPHTINSSNTYGVFGSVRWEFVDHLSISGEGRYQIDKLFQQTLAGTNPAYKGTFNSFTPRAVLQYEPSRSATFYASYSRGNRPGEFNTIYAAQPAYVQAAISAQAHVDQEVKEDKIEMEEIGFKGNLFDHRLRILLAGYVGKWTNRHIPNIIDYISTAGELQSIQVTAANGSVDLKGVEFETAFKLTPELTLEGTFDLADTKIKNSFSADALAVTGNANQVGKQLPYYPKYSASASATYMRHAFANYDGFIRGDAQYSGRIYEAEDNLAWTKPATILNLRVGIQNDQYRFEVFGTNLTNNKTPNSLARSTDTIYSALGANVGTGQGITVSLPDPRSYGVRASVKF